MRYKKVNIILLEERGLGLLKRNIVQVMEGVGDVYYYHSRADNCLQKYESNTQEGQKRRNETARTNE